MHAEILSIGTELLLGEIVDTNAQYISSRLRDIGVNVFRRTTIGDNPVRVTAAFEDLIKRADIVISTGGLGPTDDDVTAQCLASALKTNLSFNQDAWNDMRKKFIKRGRASDSSGKKQAYIVDGGFFLPNRVGTAPGQAIKVDNKLIVMLPGPHGEMVSMFDDYVIPVIRKYFRNLTPIRYTNLKIVGLPEEKVAQELSDLLNLSNPTVAPYAGNGQVRLRIAARGTDQNQVATLIAKAEKEVRKRLGHHVYGKDEETLESVIGKLLSRRGLTLAVAESITGGLINHRLTEVPGSSKYVKMGMVAYGPEIKISSLGVPPRYVYKDQAVNEEAVRAMAESIRLLAGTDFGLATTGFAGPDGGNENVAVGTVYIGLNHKRSGTVTDKIVYPSSRSRTKMYAAQRALYVLYRFLTLPSYREQRER